MVEQIQALFQLIAQVPAWGVYVLVGLGTAVENVFPPVPSDTFVLLGALLAEERFLDYPVVFAVSWSANVAGALGVYAAARRFGQEIFETRWGERLLRPHQLNRLSAFYERYGTWAVFLSRYVPVFRVLIPAFAGVSGLGFWRTALPLGLASAIWYAVLLAAGGLAARNLPRLAELVGRANWTLWAVAGAAAAGVGLWWWRSRRRPEEPPSAAERRPGTAGEHDEREDPAT